MLQNDPMTRQQAADGNLHKYWTGQPCAKGHASMRYTATGACIQCVAGYRKKFRPQPPGVVTVPIAGVPRHLEAVFTQRAGELLGQLITQAATMPAPPTLPPAPPGQVQLNGMFVMVDATYLLAFGEPIVEQGYVIGHLPLSDEEQARIALGG